MMGELQRYFLASDGNLWPARVEAEPCDFDGNAEWVKHSETVDLLSEKYTLIEQQQARIAELEQREQGLAATVEWLRNIASDLAKYPDGTVRGNYAREEWCVAVLNDCRLKGEFE